MNKTFTIKTFLFLTSTFFTVSLFAQTRITQTIEMLPWIDQAVANANEIKGGHHVYQNYSQMIASTGLKSSRIERGMLVTLIGGISGSESTTTLRLNSDWDIGGKAYPDLSDWTRVAGDGLIVNTIAERNALHDTSGVSATLEIGTIVIVVNDVSGNSAGYVFIGTGHRLDINNDGIAGEANSQDDAWFSLGGGGVSSGGGGTTLGYLYFGNGLTVFDTVSATTDFTSYWNFSTNSWASGSPLPTAAGTSFYDISTVSGVTSATAGSTDKTDNYHVFAFPKAWGLPSFYGEINGGNLFQLYDLWQRHEVDVNGVTYYAYVTDTYVNPASGGMTNFEIVIR